MHIILHMCLYTKKAVPGNCGNSETIGTMIDVPVTSSRTIGQHIQIQENLHIFQPFIVSSSPNFFLGPSIVAPDLRHDGGQGCQL